MISLRFFAQRGLPIGNLTTQFFANVLLDQVDHFVNETLRVSGSVLLRGIIVSVLKLHPMVSARQMMNIEESRKREIAIGNAIKNLLGGRQRCDFTLLL